VGLNRWQGIGNLGKDMEMRHTSGGQAVGSFNLAVNETWKDKDGQKQERTEWVRCVYWGRGAEAVAQYMVKGKQVYVEGRLQTRQWEDRDGNKKYTTEVNVQNVTLLGGGGGNGGSGRGSSRQQESPDDMGGYGMPDDDIPF
jgi:single-strand DNA-binding protein